MTCRRSRLTLHQSLGTSDFTRNPSDRLFVGAGQVGSFDLAPPSVGGVIFTLRWKCQPWPWAQPPTGAVPAPALVHWQEGFTVAGLPIIGHLL